MDLENNGKLSVLQLCAIQDSCDGFLDSISNYFRHEIRELIDNTSEQERENISNFLGKNQGKHNLSEYVPDKIKHNNIANLVTGTDELTSIFTRILGEEMTSTHLVQAIKNADPEKKASEEKIQELAEYYNRIGASNLAGLCEYSLKKAPKKGQELQRGTIEKGKQLQVALPGNTYQRPDPAIHADDKFKVWLSKEIDFDPS